MTWSLRGFGAFAALVAVTALGSPGARAEELEPETGTFAGFGPPRPYELLVRRALFEDDTYRECQFVVLPSFAAEHAVYILMPKDAQPLVISRSLKQDLWASMMTELTKSCPSGSFELDPLAESYALSKVRATTASCRIRGTRQAAQGVRGSRA